MSLLNLGWKFRERERETVLNSIKEKKNEKYRDLIVVAFFFLYLNPKEKEKPINNHNSILITLKGIIKMREKKKSEYMDLICEFNILKYIKREKERSHILLLFFIFLVSFMNF